MACAEFRLGHALVLTSLFAASAAGASPITGSGQPVPTEQPSLGLNYLVRTDDPSNLADLGQVVLFAGNFAPGGFSEANGQLLPIATNQVLFSRLGATYGGDGFNNFALPNLAGRTVVGTGQGAGLTNQTLGGVSGAASRTLTSTELPAFGGASGITAGTTPLPIRQPSIALNQTVVTQGIFPARDGAQANGPVIGQVLTFAGRIPPTGQQAATGQQLSIQQNTALFSILGITYGGDGKTTFALPNLSGRAATEAGSAPTLMPQQLGQTAGLESTTLTVANLPTQPLTLSNGKTAVIGGGQPLNVMQPSEALHYIIATQGVFPTQGSTAPDGTPFLGEVSLFAGTFAPAGWMFADGQLLSIAINPALFSIIGTTYGGNGINDFALPNLIDRFAVGVGDGVSLGEVFGADGETLNFAQLPVGYPTALTVTTNNVPEPPPILVLLAGIAGLSVWRLSRPEAPVLDSVLRPTA